MHTPARSRCWTRIQTEPAGEIKAPRKEGVGGSERANHEMVNRTCVLLRTVEGHCGRELPIGHNLRVWLARRAEWLLHRLAVYHSGETPCDNVLGIPTRARSPTSANVSGPADRRRCSSPNRDGTKPSGSGRPRSPTSTSWLGPMGPPDAGSCDVDPTTGKSSSARWRASQARAETCAGPRTGSRPNGSTAYGADV